MVAVGLAFARRPIMSTLVSVIIPTRHRPTLLRRAVDSVLAQKYEALEIIVVIDGPDSETAALIGEYRGDRLRVLALPQSIGAGPARNLGAEQARGDWLAFLDDDDEWLPEKLSRQLAAAAGREVLVTCRSLVRTPVGEELWPHKLYVNDRPIDEYLFDRRSPFRGDAHVGTSTFLLPAPLFRRTQFSHDRQNEDTTLLLRLTKLAGTPVVSVPEPLVILYKEEDRESLGSQFDWREMLAWAERMRDLLTRRAYSGFCLIYLGSQAARRGDLKAFPMLLGLAFLRGAPRMMHLLPFLSFWLVPPTLRRRLRFVLRKRSTC
jgi:glycosyltransferase involved in cell wall biosynthesis